MTGRTTEFVRNQSSQQKSSKDKDGIAPIAEVVQGTLSLNLNGLKVWAQKIWISFHEMNLDSKKVQSRIWFMIFMSTYIFIIHGVMVWLHTTESYIIPTLRNLSRVQCFFCLVSGQVWTPLTKQLDSNDIPPVSIFAESSEKTVWILGWMSMSYRTFFIIEDRGRVWQV